MNGVSKQLPDDRWPSIRLFILVGVICATLLAVWLLWIGYTTTDAEGRLFGAELGGIGVAIVVPFWVRLRGKMAKWLALSIAGIILFGIMEFNAWACQLSGTVYSHFYDHWYLLLFCLPGAITFMRKPSPVKGEVASSLDWFAEQGTWPPSPPPPAA